MSWIFNDETSSNGINPAVTAPTTKIGDLMVVYAASASTFSALAGWTNKLLNAASNNDSIWYKLAASTSEGTITLTNASSASSMVLLIYTNINATPFDVISTETTTLTTNSLTTAVINELVISCFSVNQISSWTTDPIAGTSTRAKLASTASIRGQFVADENQATIGATSTRTATSSSGTSKSAVSISFKETLAVGSGLFMHNF